MYILNKNHLSFWLRQIKAAYQLIAPLRDVSGDIVLTELTHMHETALDGPALMPSPKEFLLPQMEQLFCWSEEGIEEAFNKRPRVLFGIRPCDVSAIAILDRFYPANNKDAYYETRRRNTATISIACNRPDPTCFCLGLGTGPFLKSGFDVQLTDLGDRFLVETGSDTGTSLVRDFPHIFTEPVAADHEDLYEARLAAQSRLHAPGSGKRMRIWDTCMFKGFTGMAGGATPAKDKTLRTKRWFHHKLVHWPDQFGAFGCVGCGRCAVSCPGKIDMATVALKIKGMNQTEG
jgi:sulfhydrogenase subunit beta (sulfur reductase)